jgi:hypothetical protein
MGPNNFRSWYPPLYYIVMICLKAEIKQINNKGKIQPCLGLVFARSEREEGMEGMTVG